MNIKIKEYIFKLLYSFIFHINPLYNQVCEKSVEKDNIIRVVDFIDL